LASEAARRRHELREEQERHAETWKTLRAANRMLLQLALRERLHDPSDFEIYVGADRVTDDRGRIDWEQVAAVVDELLERRPRLAASPPTTDGTARPR
jgi:hypothetical protein